MIIHNNRYKNKQVSDFYGISPQRMASPGKLYTVFSMMKYNNIDSVYKFVVHCVVLGRAKWHKVQVLEVILLGCNSSVSTPLLVIVFIS